MKKPRIKLGGDTYCQFSEFGITDGRILVIKPELFSYGKTVDMLLQTKKTFELFGKSLKFDFKVHDASKIVSQTGVEYIDSGLEMDDGTRWAMLYQKDCQSIRLWVKREYLSPLRHYARRYEATEGGMLIAYDVDNVKIAVVMGAHGGHGNLLYQMRGDK